MPKDSANRDKTSHVLPVQQYYLEISANCEPVIRRLVDCSFLTRSFEQRSFDAPICQLSNLLLEPDYGSSAQWRLILLVYEPLDRDSPYHHTIWLSIRRTGKVSPMLR